MLPSLTFPGAVEYTLPRWHSTVLMSGTKSCGRAFLPLLLLLLELLGDLSTPLKNGDEWEIEVVTFMTAVAFNVFGDLGFYECKLILWKTGV